MLKTEQNTPAMMHRVLKAARTRFPRRVLSADFEHGQWWITLKNGAQFSVIDAEGGPATAGFDFEQVTNGDDD